ncbi:galectin-3-binding protein A-like [Cololabis saira]|uniref:galectin-3-binding protein A-like n=1 Tax=Cololabis saira TaxID=129043 RepID=UPI002AD216B5|nr:galectin-3-binding protein A-like [Cololabis saira]
MFADRQLWTFLLLLLLSFSGTAYRFDMLKQNSEPRDGDVRLSGSRSNSEGRVEVFHDGKWGTVCDDEWNVAHAQVVCRQLNFPGAKSVVLGGDYGKAPGPIWLDDVKCKGTENHLVSCEYQGWGVTDCTHKEDVGVICETGSNNLTRSDSPQSLDHRISLSDDLGRIFDSGTGCDFVMVLQSPTGTSQDDGTPEKVETTICAHKIILSLFPLFRSSEGLTNITVDIGSHCQPHFSSFIRYLYTRKIDVTSSNALCLHQLASKFEVKQLMEDIGRLFSVILPDDTSFYTQVSLYQYAVETNDLILEENCIQYLAWNYQNLSSSALWTDLSVELLESLLRRSDLVVPDEYFVFQSLETWMTEKANLTSLKTMGNLLNYIRFPMIPAEKLCELESSSPLFKSDKNAYLNHVLKALKFNILLFSNLTNPKSGRESDEYKPRIYIAEPWSTVIDMSRTTSRSSSSQQRQMRYNGNRQAYYNNGYNYGYYPTTAPDTTHRFKTPLHYSLMFQGSTTSWEANVFKSQTDCSRKGLRCESFPVTSLDRLNSFSQPSNVLFRNRLLVMCQNKYVCQVQGFKGNLAYVSTNDTQALSCPCPDDQYTYMFVVRPEYM